MSRRTVAALCVGGVGKRGRAAAVLCAMACGVACALRAGEGEGEARRWRVNVGKRKKRQPRSPYLLTMTEIVARDFLRTIPVTDGE